MSRLKVRIIITLAHLLGSSLFIFIVTFYDQINGEKEAWPIIVPALIASLALETLFVIKYLNLQQSTARFFKVSFLVFTSCIAGLICFLSIGQSTGFLYITPPILAWLFSLIVLFILLQISAQPQT